MAQTLRKSRLLPSFGRADTRALAVRSKPWHPQPDHIALVTLAAASGVRSGQRHRVDGRIAPTANRNWMSYGAYGEQRYPLKQIDTSNVGTSARVVRRDRHVSRAGSHADRRGWRDVYDGHLERRVCPRREERQGGGAIAGVPPAAPRPEKVS